MRMQGIEPAVRVITDSSLAVPALITGSTGSPISPSYLISSRGRIASIASRRSAAT